MKELDSNVTPLHFRAERVRPTLVLMPSNLRYLCFLRKGWNGNTILTYTSCIHHETSTSKASSLVSCTLCMWHIRSSAQLALPNGASRMKASTPFTPLPDSTHKSPATARTVDQLSHSNATTFIATILQHNTHRHCVHELSATVPSAQLFRLKSWSSTFPGAVHVHSRRALTHTVHSYDESKVPRWNKICRTMNGDKQASAVPGEKGGRSVAVDPTEQSRPELPFLWLCRQTFKWCR